MTELLSPAGTLKSLRFAFAYGADAVYVGQPRYSLRVRNNEFNRPQNLAAAIDEAHALGRKIYVASNVAPHNDKLRSYLRDMEPVVAMGPDALIMSDPGLILLVRERWPDMPVHLSVQANAVNWATVKFWQRQGLTRVILSRELSLDEIEEIRMRCPEMELEVFVHGALCMAYSGRCLLSGYINHRDANQGACTNACRWEYNAHSARETETGDLVVAQPPNTDPAPVLLQEKNRPEELIPVYEDAHGTYIMNSRDLRAVQHVQRLVDMGVHSLKIEGRTKSHYYVARTAQVYRRAIDDAIAGLPFDFSLMEDLEHLANRGYTEGFYRRHLPGEFQNYEKGVSTNPKQQFVGEALEVRDGWITVAVKNRFELGDELELISPAGNYRFRLQQLQSHSGESLIVAPGSGHQVRLPLPHALPTSGSGFTLLMRHSA